MKLYTLTMTSTAKYVRVCVCDWLTQRQRELSEENRFAFLMLWILFSAHKEFNLSQFVGSSFSLTLPPLSTLDGITFNWSTEVCCKSRLMCDSHCVFLCVRYVCVSKCSRLLLLHFAAGCHSPYKMKYLMRFTCMLLHWITCYVYIFWIFVLLYFLFPRFSIIIIIFFLHLYSLFTYLLFCVSCYSSLFLAWSVYFIVVHNLFFVPNSRSRYGLICVYGVSVCVCANTQVFLS